MNLIYKINKQEIKTKRKTKTSIAHAKKGKCHKNGDHWQVFRQNLDYTYDYFMLPSKTIYTICTLK